MQCDNRLTSLREVRYEPRLEQLVEQLVELPIAEYVGLRSEMSDNVTAVASLQPVAAASSGGSDADWQWR